MKITVKREILSILDGVIDVSITQKQTQQKIEYIKYLLDAFGKNLNIIISSQYVFARFAQSSDLFFKSKFRVDEPVKIPVRGDQYILVTPKDIASIVESPDCSDDEFNTQIAFNDQLYWVNSIDLSL